MTMDQQSRPTLRTWSGTEPRDSETSSAGRPGTEHTESEARWLRSVLGRFTTGVTVVTAVGSDGPVGMTANAFSSVSLNPPLVLVCLNRYTQSGAEIRKAGHFAVNILGEAQESLAGAFARWIPDRFDTIDWFTAETGAPVLAGSLGYLDCTLHEEFRGGTHSILIGRVLTAGLAPDHLNPLIFFGGGYRRLH
jgi:3-hydroxy-9,10-secoandrosta-1,3,5(10)-triene-9,17-dione monooxygenase reductase component